MPEANSIPVPSNPVGRYPGHAPGATVKPKLLDCLREALRSRHYSRRTEQTYCHWVKRFIFFHHVRHPVEIAEPEINAFLTHLAVKEKVSASTQNLALSALLFLYRYVLDRPVGSAKGVQAGHSESGFRQESDVPYAPPFLPRSESWRTGR